jgi:hypothetical protein
MIKTLCRFLYGHRRQSLPLFEFNARRPGATYAMGDHLDDMRRNPEEVCANLCRYDRGAGGDLALLFDGQPLLRIRYEHAWTASVEMDFLGREGRALAKVQEKLLDTFDRHDLEALIDLSTAFLVEALGRPFAYDLTVGGKIFLHGRLHERQLTVTLVDGAAYFKMLFLLASRSDWTLLVRSPVDIVKLAEQAQDTLRYLADCYADHELTLMLEYAGEAVFRCGRGVKPTLGARFGATALQLDALFRILKAAVPGGRNK